VHIATVLVEPRVTHFINLLGRFVSRIPWSPWRMAVYKNPAAW
jgi:hypothetical protein